MIDYDVVDEFDDEEFDVYFWREEWLDRRADAYHDYEWEDDRDEAADA
jgi:hypothetical protein